MPTDFSDVLSNEKVPVGSEPEDDEGIEASESVFIKQTSSSKYREEWMQLKEGGIERLQSEALNGKLRTARLRSVAWRVLLGELCDKSERWITECTSVRQHYADLKRRLAVNPRHLMDTPPDLDNPLSQHDMSNWHQYFCDSELKSVIHQDVVRTFPSLDFFRKPDIQQVMVDILFCYAREHPRMCYRQGMHEILAPILFVLSCDHQALLHLQQETDIEPDLFEIVNPAYLEEDGYIIFRRIMNSIEGCYQISNITPLATGRFPSKVSAGYCENQVVTQLNQIRDTILAPADPELCKHLNQLDISLPLFAIRWLRLLFGREFPLEDLLVLWDSIFAHNTDAFDLVNYIVVAMLIAIREPLLASDYTLCLSQLMRYPATMDITYIVEYALHLKDPAKYPVPKSSGLSMMSANRRMERGGNRSHLALKNHQLSANVSTLSGMSNLQRNQPRRTADSSFKPMEENENREIVEGFSLRDPLLLESELKNSYRIMSLCRLKLSQYHSVLESGIHPSNEPAQQALAGIVQICRLLEPSPFAGILLNNGSGAESVEMAAEASAESPPPLAGSPQSPQPLSSPPSRPQRRLVRKRSVDMTVFRECTTSPAPDLPVPYPYS